MANLFKRKRRTVVNGKKVVRLSKKWYGKYRDENGDVQRVPLSSNKSVAQEMLGKLVGTVERKKAGVYHPAEEHGRKPLDESLQDYLAE